MYCKRYGVDIQTYFCGNDWMDGEVDGFFASLAYWLTHYEKVRETCGKYDLEYPIDSIADDEEEFIKWANKMIEAKSKQKG